MKTPRVRGDNRRQKLCPPCREGRPGITPALIPYRNADSLPPRTRLQLFVRRPHITHISPRPHTPHPLRTHPTLATDPASASHRPIFTRHRPQAQHPLAEGRPPHQAPGDLTSAPHMSQTLASSSFCLLRNLPQRGSQEETSSLRATDTDLAKGSRAANCALWS